MKRLLSAGAAFLAAVALTGCADNRSQPERLDDFEQCLSREFKAQANAQKGRQGVNVQIGSNLRFSLYREGRGVAIQGDKSSIGNSDQAYLILKKARPCTRRLQTADLM